jgi:acyl-CoA reductase-like NAD-dependent aldehyde dehydrogenase
MVTCFGRGAAAVITDFQEKASSPVAATLLSGTPSTHLHWTLQVMLGWKVGSALGEHPLVDKLSFTGSVPTGSKVMGTAAAGAYVLLVVVVVGVGGS